MSSEIWQFAAFLAAVVVAFVLWLNIIYLPGRTLEHRYDGVRGFRHGRSEGSDNQGEVSQSSSDPTR
jgi:hypothetical protein